MTNPLSPEASPHVLARTLGIRRLNDRPLYLVLFGVGLFLAIVTMVVINRSEKAAQTEEQYKKGESTTAMVKEIIAGQEEGFIAAEQLSAPVNAAATVPGLSEEPQAAIVISHDNDNEVPPTTPQQDEQLRIYQAKLQQFEQAVSSKIAVPLSDNQRPAIEPASVSYEPREPLAASRSDATTVYQRRLAAWQQRDNSANAAPFALATDSTKPSQSLHSFDHTDTADQWALSTTVTPPRSPYELRAGAIIPATMISGINSDLPGQVIAQISQPVYDTATGKHLLLPQGTRLIGSYANDVTYGQERVFMAWQRLVFPDGKALDIGAMPGTDAAGYAGFNDQVNHHYWRIFGSAFLMSGITAGIGLSQRGQNSQVNGNNKKRINDMLTEALGQQLGTVIAQMVAKNLNIAPTLEIRPGYRFNVMVIKDMTFTKPYQPFDYTKSTGDKR